MSSTAPEIGARYATPCGWLKKSRGVCTLEIANQTDQIRQDVNLSNPACLGPFDAIQNSVYAGSDYTGVRGQELNSGDGAYRVYESAVSFPTATKPRCSWPGKWTNGGPATAWPLR